MEEVLRPPSWPQGGNPTRKLQNNDLQQPVISSAAEVSHEDLIFEERIGTGSFGTVWRCDLRGQTVAVKQCRVGDDREADMLSSEILYLQRLRHPSLVSFYACCSRSPDVFLVMEFLPGGSLHALLFAKRRRLFFSEKARMACEVAEGISYLHSLGVVHRDLKTMNIVLTTDLHCKICDFGMTLTLERTHVTIMKLQGSPRYMAPEQLEAVAKITEKVDIWQMGCVMLELFCLVVPFKECQGFKHIASELLVHRRPPTVPETAHPRVQALILACLRIQAPKRPTAGALEEALRGIRMPTPSRKTFSDEAGPTQAGISLTPRLQSRSPSKG